MTVEGLRAHSFHGHGVGGDKELYVEKGYPRDCNHIENAAIRTHIAICTVRTKPTIVQ